MLRLILILLPLGLDTLGVSVSLGIRSRAEKYSDVRTRMTVPYWLRSALLFSLAETTMPLVGLTIGFLASTWISGIMSVVGALLLIGMGLWEFFEEGLERYHEQKKRANAPLAIALEKSTRENKDEVFAWKRQLLLALSVSLDELAIGFSFGTVTAGLPKGGWLSLLVFVLYIGMQGMVMAIIGIALGRTLRHRLKPVKEWSELLSGILLIGLGIWFLVTS